MLIDQMRIAIISAHSCPIGSLGAKDTGGMSVYIREVARELGRQGHLVDVYTRVHDAKDHQVYELGQNARLIHLKAGEYDEINKLAVYSSLPEFTHNLESFRKYHNLQYDLIYSHYWLSGLAGEYLQQRWSVPHIIMFHTLGAVKNAIGIGEVEPELRIESEKRLVQSCHYIIAPTIKEMQELILYYGSSQERIGIVPCGVDLEHFKPTSKESAKQHLKFSKNKIILYVGRIDPLKGLDHLINAMSYLHNIRGLRLLIIGGGEHSRTEIEKLRKLVCDLNIESAVTFLGLIKHEQLPLFYNAADISVVPSYYESFGLVALESLACGTPVVGTDVGILRSIIREGRTGYVVSNNTPYLLASKIALFLSKSSTDAESVLSIRASVSAFSWFNITDILIRKLQENIRSFCHPALQFGSRW